jgi:hypothetical protein
MASLGQNLHGRSSVVELPPAMIAERHALKHEQLGMLCRRDDKLSSEREAPHVGCEQLFIARGYELGIDRFGEFKVAIENS